MPLPKKIYSQFVILLSWIFPKAGARLAQRIFLTPPPIPRPPSEADFFESAKKYQLPPGLAAFEWGDPSKPIVALVHGWSGRGTQMGAFAGPLVAAGFRVVAWDSPAHGDSVGETTNVGEVANSIIQAQKVLGPFHALIAHSFGAGCSVLAIQRGLQTKKVILIAGPAKYERVLAHFFELLPISTRAKNYFIQDLEKKAGIPIAEMQVGQIGRGLNVEALIVHDQDDKEVPYHSALEIQNAWPQAKLLPTAGLGHRRVLRDPQVLSVVTEFIKS